MVFFIVGSWFIALGIYCGMFIARRRGFHWFSPGCELIGVGWFCIAFHDYLISLSENASASFGSACVSAPTYSRAEDVRISSIVVAKFKFRNMEWQIFAADLVISPDDAAFDRIRVNRANGVSERSFRTFSSSLRWSSQRSMEWP
jgi:hypothetical protein